MGVSRKEMANQRVGTTRSKAKPPDISQESKRYFNLHTNEQHNGFDIFEKDGGGTENQKMTILSQKTWEILISEQIIIIVEYLPSPPNKVADLKSRRKVDSSK